MTSVHDPVSVDDPVAAPLAVAFRHHQDGHLEQAEAGYRAILAASPDNLAVLQLLAVLLHQSGESDAAVRVLHRVIELDPDFAPAHANLGIILEEQGDLRGAATQYRRAAELQPRDAGVLAHLARVLIAQGEAAEAADCLRRSAALQPPDAGACINLGNLLMRRGDVAAASDWYEKAVSAAPDLALGYSNLGDALRQLHRLPEAVACLEQACALDPALAAAHNNLGAAYLDQGLLPKAAACFEHALALREDFPEAHSNLGNVLQAQGRLDAAIAAYDRALALRPDYAGALVNRGNALWLRHRLTKAIASFERAAALRPDDPVVRAHLAHPKALACAWDEREAEEAAVLAAVRTNPGAVAPFNLLSQRSTPVEQLLCAQGWTRRLTAGCGPAFRHDRGAPRVRLRLGYLSADFREHPVAWAMAGVFEAHDRAAFEIHAYSYGPDDGSAMRARIAAACDQFVDLRALGEAEAARRIHADAVDILVDLNGHTRGARPRIAAYRPAPVQVTYLGYPSTTGADFIDAVLVDPFLVPSDQQPFFSERLVPLRGCWWPGLIHRAIAERTPSRAECGLPPEGIVFACFNNSYKITPEVFGIWMRLLTALPGSVLWLAETNRLVTANLRREAARRGVAPDRLVFATHVPIEDHLARHRLADLFLDTQPYTAVTTAYDALWAGLPVLTCAGTTFAGRQAGTMLHALGLPELVAGSLRDYEERALRLARNPASLARLRARLAQQRGQSPLFDASRGARDLEAAYSGLWDAGCSGARRSDTGA